MFNFLQITNELPPDKEDFRIMDIKFYDNDIWDLIIRFAFNFFIVFVLIKLIYRSDKRNKNYAFTFYVFNTLIFFLCYLMNNVKLDLGFAFGLFAVFSILRYRTISIPMKEMTYLFVTIAIAVINALTTKKVTFAELLFTNFMILASTFFLERLWYREHLSERTIEYEKIENIKPARHAEMMQDLKDRTGLDIREFEIVSTDFLRDMARVKIYYKATTITNSNGEEIAGDDDDD
ncbi:MAG: DUF4956 domain-containing protein [Fimbriimonadaceae bacterium]|nr:DUF4956 domain-containing protein [Chitinophagales bacterium]